MLITFCVHPPAIFLHSGGKFPNCCENVNQNNNQYSRSPIKRPLSCEIIIEHLLHCNIPSYFKDQSHAIMRWIMPEFVVPRPRGSRARGTRMTKALSIREQISRAASTCKFWHTYSEIASIKLKSMKSDRPGNPTKTTPNTLTAFKRNEESKKEGNDSKSWKWHVEWEMQSIW